jgi:hypothetical protein
MDAIPGHPNNFWIQADIGPDLTHLASRETLAVGRLKDTHENLGKWISNPQHVIHRCRHLTD